MPSPKYQLELTDSAGYSKALREIKPRLDQPVHFLNAPFYGKWQEASGKEVKYFLLKKSGKIIGCGLATKLMLPGGFYYFYCPYGPLVIGKFNGEIIKNFFEGISDNKLLFVRLDTDNLTPGSYKTANKFVAATSALQPRAEWLLDITAKEDQLLSSMHKKCRYHIRLAERRGAVFRAEKCSPSQLDSFYEMLKTTASRDGFHIMPKSDYRAVFSTLAKEKGAFIGYADLDGKPAAAALIVSYDKQAHYVYGASSDEYRKIAPGYYLQWQCILKAKADRNRIFNFGGISGSVKGDQLASVTKFKQRFGGYGQSYALPSDVVTSPLGYSLFSLYKRLRPHR